MSGTFGENSGGHIDLTTNTMTSGMAHLLVGDTVELQYYCRGSNGYAAADETAFWGAKIG